MPKHLRTPKSRTGRTRYGAHLAEFAPALIILSVFVFIPLVDLTIIPIRWMMAQELVNSYSRKLALSDTFSDALKTMHADPSLATRLHNLGGVTVDSIRAHLLITRIIRSQRPEENATVELPGRIPAQWLPDGAKAPCSYSMELDVHSLISPAILFSGIDARIPGLTAPIPLVVSATHPWENLGRNPVSKQFFVNE